MNRTILVVDDDKKIVDLVSLYLKRDGYSVLAAFDGQEALDVARRKQPDLIVLDLLLPELNGTDVCRLLRAESRVPIIMLTARSTDEDKLIGLDLGADDYLTKPFNPASWSPASAPCCGAQHPKRNRPRTCSSTTSSSALSGMTSASWAGRSI